MTAAPLISPLNDTQVTAIYAALGRAAGWAGVEGTPGAKAVQEIYDAFVEQGVKDPDRVITLGIAFGQLLVDRGNLEWVKFKDQYGEEVCVAVRGFECYCAPISMIEKRIGRAESLSIEQLCGGTLELLEGQSARPDAGRR